MVRILSIVFILFICSSVFSMGKIEIVKVCDGDTVKIKSGKEVFNLRLAGVDCYETGKINRAYKQAYLNKITIEEVVERGKYSKEYLEKRVAQSKDISIKVITTGRYGRPVGHLYLDGINMSYELIKKGKCLPYK